MLRIFPKSRQKKNKIKDIKKQAIDRKKKRGEREREREREREKNTENSNERFSPTFSKILENFHLDGLEPGLLTFIQSRKPFSYSKLKTISRT
jgi:hypothetical protein